LHARLSSVHLILLHMPVYWHSLGLKHC